MPLDTKKIKRLREKANLTLQAAATRAGFENRQQWHQVESGARENPSIDTVQRMAHALGVTVDALLLK